MKPEKVYALIEAERTGAEQEREEWDRYEGWYEADRPELDADLGAPVSPHALQLAVPTGDPDLAIETNYPFAFLDTMQANVCPLNPQVTISTTLEEAKEACKSREALLNATIRRDKLAPKLREAAIRTGVNGRCPIKTVWSTKKQMPISLVVNPRSLFFDKTRPFGSTRYVIEACCITKAEFDARLKRDSGFKYSREAAKLVQATGYPAWLQSQREKMKRDEGNQARDELEWVVIYEVYDFTEDHFFHFAEGVEQPLLHMKTLPYKYVRNPYTLIIFNQSLRHYGGISDVQLIASLLERMNEVDTLQLEHAHKSYPKELFDTASVDDPEAAVKAYKDAGPHDIVPIATTGDKRIGDIVMTSGVSGPSPGFSEMSDLLLGKIDFTLGFPQYTRGKTNTSDVATELALVDTAARTRNGARESVMANAVLDVAKKLGALWQQFLPEKKQIPIKTDADVGDLMILDRDTLGFDNEEISEAQGNENAWEDSWYYDWEVVPFSPTENHKLVQLNKLQTFLPYLSQSPSVDQQKLTREMLEKLGMEHLFNPEGAQQQAAMMQQAQMGMPPAEAAAVAGGGTLPMGSPADVIADNQMPEGTVDLETQLSGIDPRAMAQQAIPGT